jgi:GrpB-like predicted nucleotidyltransferase (UPF0157 family)
MFPRIEPYHHTPATCVQFDPRAAEVAEVVAHMVAERCPAVTVEHIGSTAIPSCAGKGIVDLMAVYPDGMLVAVRTAIDALGFQRQTFGDPFPEERPMRVGTLRWRERRYRIHVHVLAASSPEVGALRCFRDRLCANPDLVSAYVDRKRDLIEAGVVQSPDYSLAKGGFIHAVLASETLRPAATGLSPAGG